MLKFIARLAFYRAGGLQLVRYVNRRALRVLTYHRFESAGGSAAAALDWQCAYLRQHYHLVSLTQVAEWLAEKRAFPLNALAITVDDGYRDSFTVAFPVFSAYRMPVTLFLTTDFLDHKCWLWWDRLRYALEHTARRAVELPLAAGGTQWFSVETEEQRAHAFRAIAAAVQKAPNQERLELIDRLPEFFGIRWPAELPPGCEPLTWDEVRLMSRNGIEFGGHTKTHPYLSRVARPEDLREEIEGCKVRIEEELGSAVRHFCYPNGKREDISPAVVEEVRRAGFTTAVTTVAGLNLAGADPYLLKRIGVQPDVLREYFRRCAAGFVSE